MRIKSLHPAQGWRAVYASDGPVRIAQVVFFAMVEEDVSCAIPMVADDHDFAIELVPAERLGKYALLGPDEELDQQWLQQLAERHKR